MTNRNIRFCVFMILFLGGVWAALEPASLGFPNALGLRMACLLIAFISGYAGLQMPLEEGE